LLNGALAFSVVVSVKDVYDHILEQNGQDIVVMELSKELNYADHFVLTTAISPRHLIVSCVS